jgi:hypothetical protein
MCLCGIFKDHNYNVNQYILQTPHSNPEGMKEGPLYGTVTYSLMISPSYTLTPLRPSTTLFLKEYLFLSYIVLLLEG